MNSYPELRINRLLNAANVIEFPIDYETVLQSYESVRDLLDPGPFEGTRTSARSGIGLYSHCAGWNGDLRWVSAANHEAFRFFDQCFDALAVTNRAQSVLGVGPELIMYSGFFVIRSQMTDSYYHYDYSDGVGLNAMTMMTPLANFGNHGNLLYTDTTGAERVYQYKTGTAVAFGSDFEHSTQPVDCEQPCVLLCFTFGVQSAERWKLISETVAHQGVMYRHPQLGVVEVE